MHTRRWNPDWVICAIFSPAPAIPATDVSSPPAPPEGGGSLPQFLQSRANYSTTRKSTHTAFHAIPSPGKFVLDDLENRLLAARLCYHAYRSNVHPKKGPNFLSELPAIGDQCLYFDLDLKGTRGFLNPCALLPSGWCLVTLFAEAVRRALIASGQDTHQASVDAADCVWLTASGVSYSPSSTWEESLDRLDESGADRGVNIHTLFSEGGPALMTLPGVSRCDKSSFTVVFRHVRGSRAVLSSLRGFLVAFLRDRVLLPDGYQWDTILDESAASARMIYCDKVHRVYRPVCPRCSPVAVPYASCTCWLLREHRPLVPLAALRWDETTSEATVITSMQWEDFVERSFLVELPSPDRPPPAVIQPLLTEESGESMVRRALAMPVAHQTGEGEEDKEDKSDPSSMNSNQPDRGLLATEESLVACAPDETIGQQWTRLLRVILPNQPDLCLHRLTVSPSCRRTAAGYIKAKTFNCPYKGEHRSNRMSFHVRPFLDEGGIRIALYCLAPTCRSVVQRDKTRGYVVKASPMEIRDILPSLPSSGQ